MMDNVDNILPANQITHRSHTNKNSIGENEDPLSPKPWELKQRPSVVLHVKPEVVIGDNGELKSISSSKFLSKRMDAKNKRVKKVLPDSLAVPAIDEKTSHNLCHLDCSVVVERINMADLHNIDTNKNILIEGKTKKNKNSSVAKKVTFSLNCNETEAKRITFNERTLLECINSSSNQETFSIRSTKKSYLVNSQSLAVKPDLPDENVNLLKPQLISLPMKTFSQRIMRAAKVNTNNFEPRKAVSLSPCKNKKSQQCIKHKSVVSKIKEKNVKEMNLKSYIYTDDSLPLKQCSVLLKRMNLPKKDSSKLCSSKKLSPIKVECVSPAKSQVLLNLELYETSNMSTLNISNLKAKLIKFSPPRTATPVRTSPRKKQHFPRILFRCSKKSNILNNLCRSLNEQPENVKRNILSDKTDCYTLKECKVLLERLSVSSV